MEIIKSETHFNFVAMMKMAAIASVVYILIGIGSIFWHGGLNFGIDFAGGTLIQIRFTGETSVEKLRQVFKSIGLGNSIIQEFGPNEMVVRIPIQEKMMASRAFRVRSRPTFGPTDSSLRISVAPWP